MSTSQRRFVCWLSSSLFFGLFLSVVWAAPNPVSVIVVREHATGSAAAAQPHVEALMNAAAAHNGWPAVESRYFADQQRAEEFIAARSPHFGILSLATFLQLRQPQGLSAIGEVDAPKAGGKQFFIVSKAARNLQECKGASLATTYAQDARFIERVVAGGAFVLSDFDLQPQRRPLQPLKRVIRGHAKCALIDDAQKEALAHVKGGDALKSVWQSAELPGMVVVAFKASSPALKRQFQASLPALCERAREACKRVGIASIRRADDSRFKPLVDAYSKP